MKTDLHVPSSHTRTQPCTLVKDTDSEHIDPFDGVLVVVPVYSMVTAQQGPVVMALLLKHKIGSE